MRCGWFLFALVWGAASLSAKPQEIPLTVRDGRLDVGQLTSAVCSELHVPGWVPGGQVDLNTPHGADFVAAVNACLGDGCRLIVTHDTAVLQVDRDKLPKGCDALKRAARVYTAERSPEPTAAQARNWGLSLPCHIDPGRPLVVLLHGLDGDRGDCLPIAQLLAQTGYQVAFFSYPGDQSIRDSSALLTRQMQVLRATYPGTVIDVIAHSMGGLVARNYIEGPEYAGGIDRLIMVAPPNHGSKWAHIRFLLSIQQNYYLYRSNPDWHWTWLITEGLGEAGGDLLPKSDFLKTLNARPRRDGVRYTIVAGNKSRVDLVEAGWMESCSHVIPAGARGWWGFRQCYRAMEGSAGRLRNETGDTDGPVSLRSAKLRGVSDFVVLPADHVSLYFPVDGHLPKAWTVIKDRLSRR